MKKTLAITLSMLSLTAFANQDLENQVKIKLTRIDPHFAEYKIENANFKDLYKIYKDEDVLYTDKDVSFLIFGKIVKVDKNNFMTMLGEEEMKEKNLAILNKYDKSDFVKYQAKGDKKISLYVFSDITCPYCRKFHQYVDVLNQNGIEINYIPFPRNGLQDIKTVQSLKKVYCSSNPQEEFTKAFENPKLYINNTKAEETVCAKADKINQFYQYADELKVVGTPAIFTENGAYISGFDDISNFTKKIKHEIDYKKSKEGSINNGNKNQ